MKEERKNENGKGTRVKFVSILLKAGKIGIK